MGSEGRDSRRRSFLQLEKDINLCSNRIPLGREENTLVLSDEIRELCNVKPDLLSEGTQETIQKTICDFDMGRSPCTQE